MKHILFAHSLLLLSILVLCQFFSTTLAQQAPAPGPAGPTNITKILEKAGQYTILIRLMKATNVGDQINQQLNNSNNGMTIFAPTDNAFNILKPGTLNSLTDQQKVQLLQFHVIPSFISVSQFQTASNPLRTQAGDTGNGQFPLNVTTSGNQVNISTGVVDTAIDNTLYSDNQLAVYQIDEVLLPLQIFAPPSPAPAPSEDDKKSTKKKSPASDADSPADGTSADASAADNGLLRPRLVGVIIVIALFLRL